MKLRSIIFVSAILASTHVMATPALTDNMPSFNNQTEFDNFYNSVVTKLVKDGETMTKHCFKGSDGSCDIRLVHQDPDGNFLAAYSILMNNGVYTRKFCYGTGFDRQCANSDGRVVNEAFRIRSGWRLAFCQLDTRINGVQPMRISQRHA